MFAVCLQLFFYTLFQITNGAYWYSLYGGMQDWNYAYHDCMEVTVEQSNIKWPPQEELPAFWNNNLESMLSYMEQMNTGFRGYVKDNSTGAPVQADIFIEDNDYAVSSNAMHGFYYRIYQVLAQNTSETIAVYASATGYKTQKKLITITRGQTQPIRLDFDLTPEDHTLLFVAIFACVLMVSVLIVAVVALGIVAFYWFFNRRRNGYVKA